jgi:putative oxidoreductase
MQDLNRFIYPAGRAALGTLFLIAGINKIAGFDAVSGWMAASGVPAAGLMLVLTIVIEVAGGLMLILGLQARIAALAIALFLIPVTLLFHAFWSADAAGFQNQLTQFLKNVAIFGGMLLVVERESARTAARPTVALA